MLCFQLNSSLRNIAIVYTLKYSCVFICIATKTALCDLLQAKERERERERKRERDPQPVTTSHSRCYSIHSTLTHSWYRKGGVLAPCSPLEKITLSFPSPEHLQTQYKQVNSSAPHTSVNSTPCSLHPRLTKRKNTTATPVCHARSADTLDPIKRPHDLLQAAASASRREGGRERGEGGDRRERTDSRIHQQLKVHSTLLLSTVVPDVRGQGTAFHHEGYVGGRVGETDKDDGGKVLGLVGEGVVEVAEALLWEVLNLS